MTESAVTLTSYSIKREDSIDTYFHEWQSIRQHSIHQIQTNGNSNENDDEIELGIYTNSEAVWLEKLGFGNYVSQLETGGGSEDAEDTLLTNAGLSKHHEHVIRRRMTTLRSTVRSRRKKERSDESENGHTGSPASPTQLEVKVSDPYQNTTPVPSPRGSPVPLRHSPKLARRRSPRASPLPSRRSPTSYNMSVVSDKSSRRQHRNGGDLDSGVYSDNSSRDVTPVRGHPAGEGGHPTTSADVNPRPRAKAHSSPRHKAHFDQNGSKHNIPLSEMGEGVILDDAMTRNRIGPVSLNLVSKSIDHFPEDSRNDSTEHRTKVDSEHRTRRTPQPSSSSNSNTRPAQPTRRKSSELPTSASSSDMATEEHKRESKSLPRGNHDVRSVSPASPSPVPVAPLPGRDSARSPEDIKLHFGSPTYNGSNSPGSDQTEDLPNFMISPDALGITRIQDLSQQDMEKVRGVALLELTVTFDDHDIPLRSRRPPRTKNYPENALRGIPLTQLLQVDQRRDPSVMIPVIFSEMIDHLETNALHNEGLLRVPGSSARVNSLLQNLEQTFQSGHFSFADVNTNDVCSLLKQFIRELPIPLLTCEYLPAFASIADISGLKEQVRTLNLLVLLLPDVNQKVLKRLLEFCEKVNQHSDSNKMNLTNVAMVIAPNLFIKLPSRQNLDDVSMATKTSHVVRLLIKYHDLLWTIPGEMLRQIRYLYENEVRRLNPRSVQKAIKQMQHQLMEQQPNKGITTPVVSHHIIRVKAPLFTRVCMAVDICIGVTAGDIITKLQKKSRLNQDVIKKRFSSTSLMLECSQSLEVDNANKLKLPEDVVNAGEQFLFEVGGNIGERCLPNDTDMYSLYSHNPHAQWIIKPRNCPDLN